MARLLDITPTFDAFAGHAFLENPMVREQQWRDRYEQVHPDVFEAFYARQPSREGLSALVRDLSDVRQLVTSAAPVVKGLIEEVEPAVAGALGLRSTGLPRHVLMVGPMSTNALVGRLEGEVTLFHCLEWFTTTDGERVLVAHEDTHAFHEMALGQPAPEDATWTAFYEGLAIRASREVVPGRPEAEYFWYGHPGFPDWLEWCREQRGSLIQRFQEALDEPETTETWFGGGLVERRWRVGFFVADQLIGRLGLSLPELLAMSIAEGRTAIRDALGQSGP